MKKYFSVWDYVTITVNGELVIGKQNDVDNPDGSPPNQSIKAYYYDLKGQQVCLSVEDETLIIDADDHPDEPTEVPYESIHADEVEQEGINDLVINNTVHKKIIQVVRINFKNNELQIGTGDFCNT